jgi:transposase
LVFLDESGVRTDLIRRYGRGRRGVRVMDTAPDGRWQTTTFLAGLRVDGLIAPAVFDGPIDTASFTAWVEQQLVPALRPGDLVILDNLSCHRSPAVQHAVEAVGARLSFLPKYSPDLNPIELCFAKLKAILRAARCRTIDAIWHTIGQCIPRFSAAECRQYFRHCGYAAATVRS